MFTVCHEEIHAVHHNFIISTFYKHYYNPSVRRSVRPSVSRFLRWLVPPLVGPSFVRSLHWSVPPLVSPSVGWSLRWSVPLFVGPSVGPSVQMAENYLQIICQQSVNNLQYFYFLYCLFFHAFSFASISFLTLLRIGYQITNMLLLFFNKSGNSFEGVVKFICLRSSS